MAAAVLLEGPLRVLKPNLSGAYVPKPSDYETKFFVLTRQELRIGASKEEALSEDMGLGLPVSHITAVDRVDSINSFAISSDSLAPGSRLVLKAPTGAGFKLWLDALSRARGLPTGPEGGAGPALDTHLADSQPRVVSPSQSPRTSDLRSQPPSTSATTTTISSPQEAEAASHSQDAQPPSAEATSTASMLTAIGVLVTAIFFAWMFFGPPASPPHEDPMYIEPDLRRRSAGVFVQLKEDDGMSTLGVLATLVVSCCGAVFGLGGFLAMPNTSVVRFANPALGFLIARDEDGIVVGDVGPEAQALGVKPGMRIRQVDLQPVTRNATWEQVVEMIRAHPRPLNVTFEEPNPERRQLGTTLMLRGFSIGALVLMLFWGSIFPKPSVPEAPRNFVRVDANPPSTASSASSGGWTTLLVVGGGVLAALFFMGSGGGNSPANAKQQ